MGGSSSGGISRSSSAPIIVLQQIRMRQQISDVVQRRKIDFAFDLPVLAMALDAMLLEYRL